ncbi:MAG: N-acetylmuramoyl-L-alanine amidase [Hominisplanchenecus sp.]
MNKKQTGILLSLFLVIGICWIFYGKQANASGELPGLETIEIRKDESGKQIAFFSVQTDGENLTGAELIWEADGEIRTVFADEVTDGSIAFTIEGTTVTKEQLLSLLIWYEGQKYDIDLQAFQNGEDAVTVSDETGYEAAAGTEELLMMEQGNALKKTGSEIVVVLDPGHGGSDSGAYRTWDGVTYREKEIVLKLAMYTKEELDKYEGVKVYLTRSTDVALSLEERVDYAAAVGATVLISQHINSTLENRTTATGAEVMVPKGNYRPSQATETAKIARVILEELGSLGMKNRDLVYKLSETGNTYPNGKLADYYGIVRRSVLAGFPGMIVEHGFVSNPDDCKNYYGSDERIRSMAAADAAAIVKYYGLQKKESDGWNLEDGGWYYVDEGGQRMPGGWLNLNGVQYYLNEGGYRVTGWQEIAGQKYYFELDGIMQTGAVNIGGRRYFFNSKGVMKKGFLKGFDGNYYYADKNGVLYTGWKTRKGNKYYFAKQTGAARLGWAKLGKYYYYFDSTGKMQKGMIEVDGKSYYLDRNGRKSIGFITCDNKKYYFAPETGEMVKKRWVELGGNWYYLTKYGYALQNKTKKIDGVKYRFDKSGVCINR